VSGDYAYIADGMSGLRVVNVSNPFNPVEVGCIYFPDIALSVDVSGNYAYVANDYSALRVVNVSDPSNPEQVGYYITPGRAYGVAATGTYAYVADRNQLDVFDCSLALPTQNTEGLKIPLSCSLLPACPNPFNSATKISYSVEAGGRVQLVIYDILGRQVGTLVDHNVAPGNYSITWDAGDFASGIYFCNLQTAGFQQTQRVILLK
jgi:hypothetical protein